MGGNDFHLSTFRARRKTKEAQERTVGDILAAGYEKVTGAALERNREAWKEPPDRLFRWRGITVGAELFELEQFYDPRAMFDRLTQLIYQAFQARVTDDRYVGVAIGLAVLTDLEAAQRIRERLGELGVRLQDVAGQLADLVVKQVPSRGALPESDLGLRIRVDPAAYPALAAVSKSVTCSRCRGDYDRFIENAPHVIPVGSTITYGDDEMVDRITEQVFDKIRSRSRWIPVVHHILVAHDLPRGHFYQGAAMKWETWLNLAAVRTHVLDSFDEMWLVTVSGLHGEAMRIVGSEPTLDGD